MKRFAHHILIVLTLLSVAHLVPAVASAGGFTYSGSWGSKGAGDGQFDGIGAIEIDAAGNVYVADNGNERIERFTTSGAFVASWNTPGAFVEGLAVDRSGNVYATDYWTGRVLKYGASGSPLATFSTAIPSDVQGSQPTDIAVDSAGSMYVTDSGSLTLKKFDSGGNYLGALGTTGSGPGQFGWPSGVAVDTADNVYVVDLRKYDLQKFNPAGAYLGGNTTVAGGDANLLRPINVAVDRFGNSYVSDKLSGTLIYDASVKQFSPGFVFQTRIGLYSGSGMPAGTFASVSGLATDASGTVYVADGSYDRILKFTPTTPVPGSTPSVGLKVSSKSVRVGRSVTISGAVKNAMDIKKVAICRKSAGKLKLLKRVTLSTAATYRWTRKFTATGKWVLVTTCTTGGKTYTSKSVTVTVRK